MQSTLQDLAEKVGGVAVGDPAVVIHAAADIDDAASGDIVFAETEKLLRKACSSEASAVISLPNSTYSGKPMILVSDPRLAFAKVLEVFSVEYRPDSGIHPNAVIGEGSVIGSDPAIGYDVCIGKGATIGKSVSIHPFAFVGDGVKIGDFCVIHPFVCIYPGSVLGCRVVVHAGSVIGADGFGYTKVGDRHYKIPQIGKVELCDDVEIGANVTIDRARTGVTRIGKGSKIDNLVMIGHNCTIGENCIIISQTGLSGSVTVGDRVVMTGQSGIKDHVVIGDDAVLAGRVGVMGDVEPGSFLSGYPARPHKETVRLWAAQNRLLDLVHEVKDMEKRLRELEEHTK